MSKIVQELVSESLALMCTRNETCDIEQLDRDRTSTSEARAIVRFAAFRKVVTCTGAVDLEVPNCSVGIDGCKAGRALVQDALGRGGRGGLAYGKLPEHVSAPVLRTQEASHGLTDFGTRICKAVAHVSWRVRLEKRKWYLFNVVDLPDDGLPTKPMRGSRGIT